MHHRRVLQDEEGLLNFNSWKSHQRPGVNTAIHSLATPAPLGSPPSPETHPSPSLSPHVVILGLRQFFLGGRREECGKKKHDKSCREVFAWIFPLPTAFNSYLPIYIFSSESVGLFPLLQVLGFKSCK